MTYINGSLRLNEPATEHRLYLSTAELRVHLVDFVFHLLLQQQPPQSPVEELAARPPAQYLLFALHSTQHMFILLLLLLLLLLVRVRTIVTIGLSLRPVVALSDDYRAR